ncbi:MAG: hypothetical protein RI955_2046 [Bacteroidota bacterium]|jgi:SM-20-related protein
MAPNYDVLIDTFIDNEIGIDANFLSEQLSEGLQQNIIQLQQNDLMNEATIGNDVMKDEHQKVRSDKIYWMDKSHNNAFENQFLQQVEGFISHLNMSCYTGINNYEFHYAVYEKGSFYKRHKDQFKNDNNRKYSLINYLNNDWTQENGGELLIYNKKETQHILPHSKQAVFFESHEIEHEVTIANRSRMSITGWLKQQ